MFMPNRAWHNRPNRTEDVPKPVWKSLPFAVQKFSRLLVKGLNANGCQTIAFTNPPIVRGVMPDLFVCLGKEEEKGVKFPTLSYQLFE